MGWVLHLGGKVGHFASVEKVTRLTEEDAVELSVSSQDELA